MANRAGTFTQAPQAVRSARSRRGRRILPSAAGTGRTLQTDKCNAFGLTTDVHGARDISAAATARAVFRSHSFPLNCKEFFIDLLWSHQKVNPVTKAEQTAETSAGSSSMLQGYFGRRVRLTMVAAGSGSVSSAVINCSSATPERWQSGRMRRFAKPLYGLTPVPRVRIPPSPPFFILPPLEDDLERLSVMG